MIDSSCPALLETESGGNLKPGFHLPIVNVQTLAPNDGIRARWQVSRIFISHRGINKVHLSIYYKYMQVETCCSSLLTCFYVNESVIWI